jgi:hypothetical protein
MDKTLLKKILSTSKGRSKLAMSILAPLQRRMDYEGIAKRAFGIKYECFICKEDYDLLFSVYINLELVPTKQNASKRIKKDRQIFHLCDKCLKESRKQVKRARRMNPKNLPLLISDPNIFVREVAIQRLGITNE